MWGLSALEKSMIMQERKSRNLFAKVQHKVKDQIMTKLEKLFGWMGLEISKEHI